MNELGIIQDVGCHVVDLICSLAFILGALLAVEYLASLSRNTLIVLKSFKAMILGSNFI